MTIRSVRWWLLALASSLVAAPAGAVPVVYTLQATLYLYAGSDVSGFEGATFTMVASMDTEDPPLATGTGTNYKYASWELDSVQYTVSNRPGSLPDVTVAHDTWFDALNSYAPSTFGDNFGTNDGTCFGAVCTWGGLWVFFGQGFIPGTDFPSPPVWSPADVVSVFGYLSDFEDAWGYDFADATFTASVPEPATALLLGSIAVATSARRRLRSLS